MLINAKLLASVVLAVVGMAFLAALPQALAQYALEDGPMQPQTTGQWRPRGSEIANSQVVAFRQPATTATGTTPSAAPSSQISSPRRVVSVLQTPAEPVSFSDEVFRGTAVGADRAPAYQRPPLPAVAMRNKRIAARQTGGYSDGGEDASDGGHVEVIPPGYPQPPTGPQPRHADLEPQAEAFGLSCGGERCWGQDVYSAEPCEDAYGVLDCDGCGMCARCWGLYDPYPPGCGAGLLGAVAGKFMRDISLFAGPHAFRGPMDFGANGNFGFHWGVNLGGATGMGNIGYQVGFAIATSNLKAHEIGQFTITTPGGTAVVGYDRSNRNQYFFTAGLFKRALCGGIQWGVAVDLLHDEYYDQMNLKQVRSETSYVFRGGRHEIGYFGSYQTSSDVVQIAEVLQNRATALVAPTDIYAAFYRQYFANGSEARLWGGVTGRGQAVVGGDVRLPLGGPVAIETSYNYIIPNSTRDVASQTRFQETWGININLVWYPGRSAACVHANQFRPLLGVADNSSLMVRTGDPVWR